MSATIPAQEMDIVEHLRELATYPQPPGRRAALNKAAAEIERLRERLEMTHAYQLVDGKMTRVAVEPGSIPDGIECRDGTISLQDKHIKDLIERLRDARAAEIELKVVLQSWIIAEDDLASDPPVAPTREIMDRRETVLAQARALLTRLGPVTPGEGTEYRALANRSALPSSG